MIKQRRRRKRRLFDNKIWKKTKIDSQGRVTLPRKLRKALSLNKNSKILWEDVSHYKKRNNEFLILVGIENANE